ncbi:MAG: translation elongation factor Ts [Candidatus Dadabacteria bacterium]|nr:MAG: translation elongation factor Ts [Candidatus Dadabacteria bacterium]
MTEVTASLVKELREKTGAGMMDCKAALVEANGDIEQAIEVLRKKGLKDLGKRAGKVAAEGVMGVYSHPGDQIVAVVELNCETDFVARGEEFKEAARGIAMHVAAMNPQYLSIEDIPEEVIEKEKEIILEQLNEKQKDKADKIIPGKLQKFYADTVLLEQPYVKDDSGKKTVREVVEELGVKTGEKVVLRRFIRMQVGEGIEKAQTDFAAEVAEMVS